MNKEKKTAADVAATIWDKAVDAKLKKLDINIDALKAEHKKIRVIHVPLAADIEDPSIDEVATFVIKRPSRAVTNACIRYAAEKVFQKANEAMIKNCVLGGEMEYLEEGVDEDIYMTVLDEIGETVDKRKAIVKKY